MKVVYFGSDVFLSCFEYFVEKHQVLALYTYHNDEDYFTEYAIVKRAGELGIPVHYEAISPEDIRRYFTEEGCELFFIAEYDRILTLPEELPAFRAAFAAYAGAHLSEEDYEPKVSVEFEMMPEELTLDLVEELSLLEPYGMGNPKPYFGCRNVRGREAMAIGREQNHLRFKLGTEDAPVTSLMWNRADLAAAVNREALDVVYAPAINEWNGRRSLQCMVEDLSPAASERVFPEKELLRDIYRYFYAMQRGQGLIPFDTAALTAGFCQSFHHISQYTMGAALRIFQELGILRENLNENRYYLPPVQGKQGKMELDASPTYRRHKVI